jgi:hypothetical protein
MGNEQTALLPAQLNAVDLLERSLTAVFMYLDHNHET